MTSKEAEVRTTTTTTTTTKDHPLYGPVGEYVKSLLSNGQDMIVMNQASRSIKIKFGKKKMKGLKRCYEGDLVKLLSSYPSLFHVGCRGKYEYVAKLSVKLEPIESSSHHRNKKRKRKDDDPAVLAMRKIHTCVNNLDFEGAMKAYRECRENKETRSSLKKTLGSLLHVCVQNNKRDAALEIYKDLKKIVKPNESVFHSLILLERNNMEELRKLLQEMRDLKVVPRLRDWTPIIARACVEGHKSEAFQMFMEMRSVLPICVDPNEEIFRSLLDVCLQTKDFQSFYFILEEMLEVVTCIQDETRDVMERFFKSLNDDDGNHRWKIVQSEVEKKTGRVIAFDDDIKVKLVHISDFERKELSSQVAKITCKGKKKTRQFQNFMSWLKRNGPFDVFIDTANVGLFCKNRPGGGHGILFSAQQVEAVRKYFVEQGRKPLLVMHSKWMQRTPSNISKGWKHCNFVLQRGNNDDLYWMAAAVSAGNQALIVSNDQMRDHSYAMLAPRTFTKFKQAHIVKYKFEYVKNQNGGFDPIPCLDRPPVYSRRIQKTERGYHFPLTNSEDWFHAVLPVDTPKELLQKHLGPHQSTDLDGKTITLGARKGTNDMFMYFLGTQVEKLNGISTHMAKKKKGGVTRKKRKREDEDNDGDVVEVGLDTSRFLRSLSKNVLKEFDGLTKSTMEKIEAVFRDRLFWDLRKNVPIGSTKPSEEVIRQVLESRREWLYGKISSKKFKKSD